MVEKNAKLIDKDFFGAFEHLDYLYEIKDEDSLIVEIDLILANLDNELLMDLERNYPNVVGFIRKNFPQFSN